MKLLGQILSWFFTVLFVVATASFALMGNWLQAVVLMLVALVAAPPFRGLVAGKLGKRPPWWAWIAAAVGLLALLVLIGALDRNTSIYKSPAIEARFHSIYAEKMKAWPVPYEDVFVDTSYGKVHVIASGDRGAPPLLLLHASGVAGWSWKYNVAALSERYRTYAVDLIGDAGLSEFTSLDHIMGDGRDQAGLYKEITDALGVQRSPVIGASEGGFIATNYALHFPERVEKLVLLGPMGYSGALASSLRIMLAQMFPLEPIQDSTFRWAFSDSEVLKADFDEWFRLLMTGYIPAKVIPLPFSPEQRRSIAVPVMFVFGTRDNLVGDPAAARAGVQDIPDVRVEVIEAGHLMAGEKPQETNRLILDFLASPRE